MFRTLKSNSPFSAPHDDAARASCGNGAKAKSYQLQRLYRSARSALVALAAICCPVSLLFAQEKNDRPPFTLSIKPDRSNALYRVGENITFTLTLLDAQGSPVPDKKVPLIIYRETHLERANWVSTAEPGKLVVSMNRPGFVLVGTGTRRQELEPGNWVDADWGGAGIEPERIRPGTPAPGDFDAFWQAQKARLTCIPMNPRLEPVATLDSRDAGKVETFDVKLDCVDGVPVSGYYSRPKGAALMSRAAVLYVHEAGVRSARRMDERARELGILAMDINAHGIPNGRPAEFYKYLETHESADYRSRGRESRETCYFNGMFMRVLRALEFLKAQPEWDGKNLLIWGGSQGGGQGLAGAALDPQVTAIWVSVPAMCNHLASRNGDWAGWPNWILVGNGPETSKEFAATAPYYDMCNFAPRIKARVCTLVGFLDMAARPSSVFAMYNCLKSPKRIICAVDGGHGATPVSYLDLKADFSNYLEQLTNR